MKIDFAKFSGSLPYSSELYGIYQPLLGWRSRLMTRRFEAGINNMRRQFLANFVPSFHPRTQITAPTFHPREVQFRIDIAEQGKPISPLVADTADSFVARRTLSAIEEAGINKTTAWKKFTSPEAIAETLASVNEDVRAAYEKGYAELELEQQQNPQARDTFARQMLTDLLARESVAAGVLTFINAQGDVPQMMSLFTPISERTLENKFNSLTSLIKLIDPRQASLAKAVISPIGVVHLFRQYFFEFDTFLGPPVEHLWLSPGGTVELIEVSTRKSLIERNVETAFESLERSEKERAIEDEFSDAVRSENTSNTKFGVSLNTTTSFSAASLFTSQVSTGTSFNLDDTQKESREQLHKGLRRQSEKIASELKRSFKSSFKTVTEVTDTKSRRYVIQNTTEKLVNYELRRKMRQVGVQVQDYGVHLCWQTYVDKPGDDLGIADLVHIAVPGDMAPVHQPTFPPDPVPYKGETIRQSFRWPLGDEAVQIPSGDFYAEFLTDVIVGRYPVTPTAGFRFSRALVKIASGRTEFVFAARGKDPRPVAPGAPDITDTAIEVFAPPVIPTGLPAPKNLRHGAVEDNPEFILEITPEYEPSKWLLDQVRDAKEKKIEEANQEQQRQYKEKLFAAIKERVKLSHNIQPRRYEDLREEERIVVYRELIRQLMKDTGVEAGEPRVQHLFAELIQAMFDVDKMLYFVAPEWWMPRAVHSRQDVFTGTVKVGEFMTHHTINWGGGKFQREDNYYITEDSAPAKLGSSLGWTIQLDGDNMRNAFLNAPWVKAVIPIREWKENEAIEWLSASEVEGSDGLDAEYKASAGELERIREALGLVAGRTITIQDAINYLIARVQQTHAAAREKVRDEAGVELGYLPTDKVYEHGFDPLLGGFKIAGGEPFEVFDQWVEVVPTDQIAPVEVEYDPRTGMQKEPVP